VVTKATMWRSPRMRTSHCCCPEPRKSSLRRVAKSHRKSHRRKGHRKRKERKKRKRWKRRKRKKGRRLKKSDLKGLLADKACRIVAAGLGATMQAQVELLDHLIVKRNHCP
jgi:hypothetical protein